MFNDVTSAMQYVRFWLIQTYQAFEFYLTVSVIFSSKIKKIAVLEPATETEMLAQCQEDKGNRADL